jgi:hypothetical protein
MSLSRVLVFFSWWHCGVSTLLVILTMNPLFHADTNLPTALGLCMECVRRGGQFNMVTEFFEATRFAYALYESTMGQPVPWPGDPKDYDHAFTLVHYMAAYALPEYLATLDAGLRNQTLRSAVAAVDNTQALLVRHRQDTAATIAAATAHRAPEPMRRSARLAKK